MTTQVPNSMLKAVESDVTASSALAAAIWIHTLEESFQAMAYQKAMGMSQPNSFSEVLVDSLPIFLILPLSALASTRYLSWLIRDTLLMVCLLHPLLDHVALAIRHSRRRPGSFTALAGMLPLGALVLLVNRTPSMTGGGLGLLISILLYVAAQADIEDILKRRDKKG